MDDNKDVEVKESENNFEDVEVKESENNSKDVEVKELENNFEEVEVKEPENNSEDVEVKEPENNSEDVGVKEPENNSEDVEVKESEDNSEELEEKESEEKQKIQIPNIMIAGATGVGKSTLLNAVFKFEEEKGEGAKTGIGLPITDEIKEYKNDYICIWDTVGLEIDNEKTNKIIQDIKDKIAEKAEKANQDKKETDLIHAIWYCINVGSKRYQKAELDFIKKLHENKVPFFIILTQCFNEDDSNEVEKIIKDINKENGLDDIDIIQVVAKEWLFKVNGQTITVKQRGLNELVELTLEKIPEYVKDSFIAAQKISKELKMKSAFEIIKKYVEKSKNDFADYMFLVRLFTTSSKISEMQREIFKIYNCILEDEDMKKFQLDNLGFQEIHREFNKRGYLSKNIANISELLTKGIPFFAKLRFFYLDKNQLVEEIKDDIKNKANSDESLSKFAKENLIGSLDRSAILIFAVGINFVIYLEKYWDKIIENKSQSLSDIIEEMAKSLREALKKFLSIK